jgi:hypothetical protein
MPDIMRARRCLLKADGSGVSVSDFIGDVVLWIFRISVHRLSFALYCFLSF